MTPLSELCTTIVDCEHKTAPKTDDAISYPLVRTTDIGRGRIDLTNAHRVDADAYAQWTRRAVPQPGDLILAREAPVGNVGLVTPGMEPVLGQRTVLIRPDEERVDPQFLTYRLLAHDIQHWMTGVANGATVPHLNMEDIRALPLPELPSLRTQNKIGAALSSFDDLIENNRRRIEILEEMARLLYREWFVYLRFPGHNELELVASSVGCIPREWSVSCLGDEVKLQRQSVKPYEYADEEFDHYSIPAFDAISRPSIEFGSDIRSGKYLLTGQSVLVSKLNPRFPRVWRVDASEGFRRAVASTEFLVLTEPTRWPLTFIYGVVSSAAFSQALASTAGGTSTSHQRAKPADVMAMAVACPPLELMQRYTATVKPMLDLSDILRQQVEVLREARDLLLPRLVSGELDISDLDLELEAVGV